MEKIESVIAYLNTVDKQNDILSTDAFINLKKVKGLPVTENFDYSKIIGRIEKVVVEQNEVIATMVLNAKIPLNRSILRICAKKIKSHERKIDNKDITIIDKAELVSVGLIDKKRDVYTKKQIKGLILGKVTRVDPWPELPKD